MKKYGFIIHTSLIPGLTKESVISTFHVGWYFCLSQIHLLLKIWIWISAGDSSTGLWKFGPKGTISPLQMTLEAVISILVEEMRVADRRNMWWNSHITKYFQQIFCHVTLPMTFLSVILSEAVIERYINYYQSPPAVLWLLERCLHKIMTLMFGGQEAVEMRLFCSS